MVSNLKQPHTREAARGRSGGDSDKGGRRFGGRDKQDQKSSVRGAAKPTGTSYAKTAVKRADVILFVNQMAVMLDTGVPLSEAVNGIADRTADPKYREILLEITASIESGEPLSSAMSKYPKAFPPIMIALLRASEASGTMSEMLNRIALYLTKEYQILRQVRGAMMYPAFMMFMCVSVTVLLLTMVLPQFAGMYASKGAALPLPTLILMNLSELLLGYSYYWIAGTIALAIMVWAWARTQMGQTQIDWLKLKVPIFSNMFSKLYLSRGCRTIGIMIETGVSLLDTISIAREVTRNVYYERLWDQIDSDLRQGKPLSDAMYDSAVFPDHIAQMVESGEKSGRLAQVFNRVADFTETEFDQAVKTATQFIEPIMIVTMGSIIGFIAVALLIPIFSMGTVASGH